MRTSFAVVLAMAIGINAVPQASYSVQPISQISDGQIQAPPATATEVPSASVPVVVPTGSVVVPPVVSSIVEGSSGAPVVPITATITGPVVIPTSPIVIPTTLAGGNATVPVVSSVASFLNSTVLHSATSAAGPTSAGSSATASAPAQPGAANTNMLSLGTLAMAAVAGVILA